MNIVASLEFELAYYDVAVQHINHYATRAPLERKTETELEEVGRKRER